MHVSFSFLCVERGFGFLLSLSCFCFDGGFVVFFCSVMARSLDKIKSIDGLKETLKLNVRISDLWFIGTPNKFEQAKMVFVDSDVCFNSMFFFCRFITYYSLFSSLCCNLNAIQGDEIHAVCKQDQLK